MSYPGLLIHNARMVTPLGILNPGWLMTRGREIAALGQGRPPEFEPGGLIAIDAQGDLLLPGFIDLHAHGAVGYEVMDADPDGLDAIARFYARHGVTAFLATTWTATREAIRAALEMVAAKVGRVEGGATILGAHLEGPYLNPVKCGAQDVQLIRRADREEVLEILDYGVVRLVAMAPEYPENLWLIDECVRRGVTVSAAHTTAGLEELTAAAQRGLSHVTHFYNAMTPLGHRDLGTVGAVMALPELTCELIADNIHVHPAAQKILVDVKGLNRVVLVTDAIRGTGLADGDYRIDNRTFTIHGGEARLPDGTLVGSVLTMEKALKNALTSSGQPLSEAWCMSSLNAARQIGVAQYKGSLERGKDADLVLSGEDLTVKLTMIEGEVVFSDPARVLTVQS